MLKDKILKKKTKLKLRGAAEFALVAVVFVLLSVPLSKQMGVSIKEAMSYLLILIGPALYFLAKRHLKMEERVMRELLEGDEKLTDSLKSQDLTVEAVVGKKAD